MNSIKLILILVLLMILVNLTAQPEISFNFLTHDFGEIKEESGKVSYDFSFTNTGDDTLKVIKVKAS